MDIILYFLFGILVYITLEYIDEVKITTGQMCSQDYIDCPWELILCTIVFWPFIIPAAIFLSSLNGFKYTNWY